MIPGVGQVANVAIGKFTKQPYDDNISASPAISLLESSAGAPYSIYKAVADDGSKKKAVKDTLSLITLMTGVPVVPLSKPIGYMLDVSEGNARPTGPIDYTRGLITGKKGAN
jgi:hypothetical protein